MCDNNGRRTHFALLSIVFRPVFFYFCFRYFIDAAAAAARVVCLSVCLRSAACFIFVLICVIEWLVLISLPTPSPSPCPAPVCAIVRQLQRAHHKCAARRMRRMRNARAPQHIEQPPEWPSDQVTSSTCAGCGGECGMRNAE